MNNTPRANRTHIGIFGLCNAGKSQLLNAITSQNAAIVSPQKGTTTDPVYKSMELAELGPVVMIDTPGLDDETLVGKQRIAKTDEVLRKTDIALLVIKSIVGFSSEEKQLIDTLKARNIPFIVVQNKTSEHAFISENADISVDALTGENIGTLKNLIAKTKLSRRKKDLLEGLVNTEQLIVLVTPIDDGAPKGRIILPQQQAIRDILDKHSAALIVQPEQLNFCLDMLHSPPSLVITDSQVFGKVASSVPNSIPLTSFSILFARQKGILQHAVRGVRVLDKLQDNSNILIAEGCTHHRQCEDIGTVKIPRWIAQKTKKKLNFSFVSGGEFPDDLSGYSLVVHCGGCMINDGEMSYRLSKARLQNIPITNYGILISYLQGTLNRSIEVFNLA